MSSKYKFADNDKLYSVSFAITNWIDLFIREAYKEEILKSIRKPEEWKYSSAPDYFGGKGLLEIMSLDTLIV